MEKLKFTVQKMNASLSNFIDGEAFFLIIMNTALMSKSEEISIKFVFCASHSIKLD